MNLNILYLRFQFSQILVGFLKIRIKLNRRGRKAVRGKRTTRVWATTVLKHRGGTLDGFSERVKLKR